MYLKSVIRQAILLVINKPHLLCSKECVEEMYRVSRVGSSGKGSTAGRTVWRINCKGVYWVCVARLVAGGPHGWLL